MSNNILVSLKEQCECWLNMDCYFCDAIKEIERLQKELDLWHKSAVELARQLGKEEYAEAEYINQKVRGK